VNAPLALAADEEAAALGEAQAYFAMLAELAAGQDGKLVLATFGEGLAPQAAHFDAADADATEKMLRQACQWAVEPGRNIYAAGALMRPDLPAGRKGGEADVAAVLLLAADFDAISDPRAGEWESRLPLPADVVVETSHGSFQALYLLETAASVAEVKPVAHALTETLHSDPTGKDLSHVWRPAGLLNWPNAKKLSAGRSPQPFTARFVNPWDGRSRTSLAALRAAIPAPRTAAAATVAPPIAVKPLLPKVRRPLPKRLEAKLWHPPVDGEDRSAAAYGAIKACGEHGLSAEAIEDAFAKHPESAAAQHYTSAEQLQADIARTLGKPSRDPDWVADMNRDFSVVNEGGRMMVFRFLHDPELKRERIERISFEDLRKMFLHERVATGATKDGGPIYSTIGQAWLAHPHRRQFLGGVAFAPGSQLPPDMLNLWRGFGVEAKAGDWSAMRDHIRDVICAGSPELFGYVMGWLARCVQLPGEPGEVALVLRGGRGTGKGTFGHGVGRMFGQHYLYASSARQLLGNFNAHLRDAVFGFADEAFYAGDRSHESQLKALVTEPYLTIEAKYRDAVTIKNSMHLLMASNDSWVVPAGTDERRFCVLDVSAGRQQDRRYFDEIHRQMKAGGTAAMLFDLLAYDLTGFDVRDVPQTEALRDQKLHSLRGVASWIFDCLQREQIGPVEWTKAGASIASEDAHARYRDHSAQQREYRPLPEQAWGRELRKVLGAVRVTRPRGGSDTRRPRVLAFPPIEEARQTFEKYMRIDRIEWDGGSDADPFA